MDCLLNVRDGLHVSARQIFQQLQQKNVLLLSTEFVFLEVADAFCVRSSRLKVATFLDGMRSLPILEIIPVNQELLDDGWNLYKQRPDKDRSLTDCLSFVVMTQQAVTQAFTSDHHFEQAGFTKLL